MKPFGSLPRPRSRFRRPRYSWLRRVLSAGRLRLSFLLVYLLVAGTTFAYLYGLARQYGYFYSTRERVALWREFPEPQAVQTLVAIYGDNSTMPEMRLIQQASRPFDPNTLLIDLLKDPRWAPEARKALSLGFDVRLQDLEANPMYYRFEALMTASDNGRLLNKDQRQRLDTHRRGEVEWFIREAQPESEARTQAFRFRLGGWFSQPWPLEANWCHQMILAAQHQQRSLTENLSKKVTIEDLRRLQVQVRLTPLLPELRTRLLAVAKLTRDNQPREVSDEQLILLAHFKKLLPELDLRKLSLNLPEQKRALLDCLADLSTNP